MSEFEDIDNQEESGNYFSDILLDQKVVTKVKNHGSFDLIETEGTKNSLKERLNRKNIIYYGIMQGEQVVNIEQASFKYQAPIIQIDQIKKRLSKIKDEHRSKIGYIHLNSVQMIIRSTFREGIKTPLELVIEDNRIMQKDLKRLGRVEGDLGYGVIKFNITLQYPVPLLTRKIDNCISISCDFKQKELMESGDIPLVICYQVAYALSNSSISLNYKHLERLYTNKIFNETSTIIKEDKLQTQFLRDHGNRSLRLDRATTSRILEIEEPITKRNMNNESQIEKINQQVKELSSVVTNLNNRI